MFRSSYPLLWKMSLMFVWECIQLMRMSLTSKNISVTQQNVNLCNGKHWWNQQLFRSSWARKILVKISIINNTFNEMLIFSWQHKNVQYNGNTREYKVPHHKNRYSRPIKAYVNVNTKSQLLLYNIKIPSQHLARKYEP